MAGRQKLAVLASGSGSNLQALLDADLGAEIAVVIVNVPGARAIARAEAKGVPVVVLPHKSFPTRDAFDRAIAAELQRRGVDWVILAGFMRILGPAVLAPFANRVVNIHPALLPAFPGTHAQKQALEAGVSESGCTVHLVDAGTDTGPILAQRRVPVLPGDTEATLSARILVEEHRLLPAVVRALVAGGLDTSGPRPKLAQRIDGP